MVGIQKPSHARRNSRARIAKGFPFGNFGFPAARIGTWTHL